MAAAEIRKQLEALMGVEAMGMCYSINFLRTK